MITCLILSWENILYKLDASLPHFMHTHYLFKKLIFKEINSGFQHLTAFEKMVEVCEKKNFGAT